MKQNVIVDKALVNIIINLRATEIKVYLYLLSKINNNNQLVLNRNKMLEEIKKVKFN